MDEVKDLQKDFKGIASGQAPEVPTPEVPTEGDHPIFSDVPSPMQSQVDQWKTMFPRVCMTTFDDGSFFVWHTMNRLDWRKKTESIAGVDQATFDELMLPKVLLWPENKSRDFVMNLPAGQISTIMDQCVKACGFVAAPPIDL